MAIAESRSLIFLHLIITCLSYALTDFFFIQDIDIKHQGAVSPYGFVQYTDISSVVKALHNMEGKHIGANRVKVRKNGFIECICW